MFVILADRYVFWLMYEQFRFPTNNKSRKLKRVEADESENLIYFPCLASSKLRISNIDFV